MFTQPDTRYAHHRQYLKAGDVPTIPYLGGPEDRFASAFRSTYQTLVHVLRTPTFQEHLASAVESTGVSGALALLDRYIDDTNDRLAVGINREIRPVVYAGAARARQITPFAKASSEALALPRSRPRPAPRSRRAPGPYRPLPPYRQLLRIPWNKYSPPPATQGRTRGHVNQAYLNATDLLTLSLVQKINETQKDKIVDVIRDAVRKGQNIDIASMRVANMVGLFPRWQQAVLNFQYQLEQQNLPNRVIQTRVNDYADWLRERRGIMIARTELVRAMNTGRLIAWHEMADDGQFSATETIKEWVAAPDACPKCLALDGKRITNIDNKFRSGNDYYVMPPAHPHCRCTVVIHPAVTDDDETPSSGTDESQAVQDEAALNDPEMQQLLGIEPDRRPSSTSRSRTGGSRTRTKTKR